KDTQAKYIVNSAGEPFEQSFERESSELTITMTRNEETFDAAFADQFSHTVNEGAIVLDQTTFGPGTLKLSPISATGPHVENFVTFYRVTYIFKARRSGWKDKRYDVGFNELVEVVED